MIGPGIVLVALVVSTSFTIFYMIKSRHLESMARIEHGIAREEDASSQWLLNLGLFLCSLAIGVFLAYLLDELTSIPDYISIPGCLLLSGGIGLIVGYLVNRGKTR